jgi:hypothetical protein
MSSTWVIHFFDFLNLLDFAKSNSGAGCDGFDPKVGSIPASRTNRSLYIVSLHFKPRMDQSSR